MMKRSKEELKKLRKKASEDLKEDFLNRGKSKESSKRYGKGKFGKS
jgi:hypothetical protein